MILNEIPFIIRNLATSEEKLDLLRKLLKENPDLGMKEANLTIREQFGTGVAPPQYSKVKKELEGSSAEEEPVKVKVTKSTKKSIEASASSENIDLESFFDGSAAQKVQEVSPSEQETIESTLLQEETTVEKDVEIEEIEETEEVEEDLTPVPTFPVSLEVTIPDAESVHLAGSFNKWKTEQYPMQKNGDQNWVFNDELPEGEHFYKFVVDNKLWHLDMNKEYFIDPTGISHKITVSAS